MLRKDNFESRHLDILRDSVLLARNRQVRHAPTERPGCTCGCTMHDSQGRPPVCIKHFPTLRAVVVNDAGPISGHANRLKLLISSSGPLISILKPGDRAGFDVRRPVRSLARSFARLLVRAKNTGKRLPASWHANYRPVLN